MTSEAKKRKNQKKKLRQRQKKAAEKAASHNEQPLESPESTISISFNNNSLSRTESDITPESDALPVSSSTNISSGNDIQLQAPDTQELHNELCNESSQHDIVADRSDFSKNLMIENNSFSLQTKLNGSQEDVKTASVIPSSEPSPNAITVDPNDNNDNNENARKAAAIFAVNEDVSSDKECGNYDSVIISSNDGTNSHNNHSLSSSGSLLSPELPSDDASSYNISLGTTDNDKNDGCHYNDKNINLNLGNASSQEHSRKESAPLKMETQEPTEERMQNMAHKENTNDLYVSDTEASVNVMKCSDDDASKLFQDDNSNQKLPWEEDAERPLFNESIDESEELAAELEQSNEFYTGKENANNFDSSMVSADRKSSSEENLEEISQEHNKQEIDGHAEKNIETENFTEKKDIKSPSSAEVGILETGNDIQDETDSLFAQDSEELGEALPWESGGKNADVTSESKKSDEDLFAAAENNEKLPWEISEDQTSSGNTKNSTRTSTEKVAEQKFSFLEDDDDLLDDDSFLASSEEEEATIDTNTTEVLSSKPVEEKKASRYEPVVEHKTRMHQEQAQFTNTAGIVTPQQFHGLAKNASNVASQQVNVPSTVGPKPPVIKDSNSIIKINEEKKKSDAYDFPLEIISESSKKGHAKPVAVPTQRFGSGNSFSSLEKPIPQSRKGSSNSNRPPVVPLGAQMSRPSRTNSTVSQTPLNYAFPNPYKIQQPQQSSIQQGIPLLNANIPPPTLQLDTNSSAPPIRARGISNASVGSTTSFGARRPTQYGINNGQSPVSPYGHPTINLPTANKYAPISPTVQQGQYPSISQNLAAPVVNNHNFVKTHRGHTSSISSYTPNQNEHASRYAPNNQQSYQVPQASQPVPPTAAHSNFQTQLRNSYVAPMVPSGQIAASIQPHMNIQAPVDVLPLMPVQNSTNLQPRAINVVPANSLPLANAPLSGNIFPESVSQQSANSVAPLQRKKHSMQLDNGALLNRQFPIFHWSSSNKVVYTVPSIPDQSHYMISSNLVQDIRVVSVDQIIKPNDMLKSFPGPLSSAKLKKKDLIKWMETTIKAISANDSSADMTIWKLLEMKLSDKISWENISKLLYNSDELLMYLSQPFPNTEIIPNAYRLDINCQMRILAFLQTGNHDEALRLALGRRDYAIALLIGSLMGKDKWSEVIQEYLYEEFTAGPNDQKVLANFLFLIFQVFVGNSKMTLKNFYANEEASQWALTNWKSIVAAVLINIPENVEEPLSIPPVVLEFLIEFGIFLTKKGLTVAASTLFIIGNVPLSNEPVMADSDVIFESIGNVNTFESVLWGEIYEYIFSCDSKFKVFPSILPQKVYHASLLQEQGLTNLATKYTDYLGSSIRKLPRKNALTINLTRELSEVVTRLSESNTGWLAKPKLSSVWGQLDKSFNKYIGGDDVDALSKKNEKKKVFDGFTPGSSANSSTVDLTQTFTPFQAQVTSQSYVDTTALLHNTHNAPINSVLHSKPSHVSKNLAEASLPYTHRVGDSLQGSPQRIQNTQYATVDPQMTSLRRVRTDQHASEMTSKSQQKLDKKPTPHALQSGQNYSIPMEKSNSNAPSLFADFTAPPKFGRMPSNYMSSPDLVRRESIISTGSDFLPPPKVGGFMKTNSSQGSLMYSPSVEALPIDPIVPPDHEKRYDVSSNKHPQESTPEQEFHIPECNNNTDQNTLKDFAEVTGETMDIEASGLDDEKSTSPIQINNQATFPVSLNQDVVDEGQLILESDDGVRNADASKIEKNLSVNENEKSGEEQPQCVPKSVSSAYLPSADGVSLKNEPPAEKKSNVSKPVPSTYLPSAENALAEDKQMSQKQDISLKSKPISEEQNISVNIQATVATPIEQHILTQKPKSTTANKMHYSPYMPQTAAASANGDVPTILEAPPTILAGTPHVQTSSPSPYSPLSNKTNESTFEPMAQSHSNSNALENRFNPMKKAEVVEKDTFEPTIRKASTNQYRAFKPLESDAGKYNDVIEEESDEDVMSADEGKSRKQERRKDEDTKKESKSGNKDIDDKSNGWFGWLKKDTGDKKVYKAKLGHKNTLYYDEKLKRWVNKNATEEEKQKIVESSAPPPPPIVKRKDGGPKTKPRSGPINNSLPPINSTTVVPNNPITGEPLPIKSSPSAGLNLENSPPPSSPTPNISGVNLTGKKANGLDDLLNLAGGPKPASTRRKKKMTRGYINVMDNIQ